MLPNLSALQPTGAGANDGIPAMSHGASGIPPAVRGMYQNHLLREGWVVIPAARSDAVKLQQVRDAFDQHFRESPELLNPPEDPTWSVQPRPLGNPSSFHHPFVRDARDVRGRGARRRAAAQRPATGAVL